MRGFYWSENVVIDGALRVLAVLVVAYMATQNAGWDFWVTVAFLLPVVAIAMALTHPALRRRHDSST